MTQFSQQPRHAPLLSEADVQRIREAKPSKPRKPMTPELKAKLAAGIARWRAAKQTAKSQPPQPVETARVWEGRKFPQDLPRICASHE